MHPIQKHIANILTTPRKWLETNYDVRGFPDLEVNVELINISSPLLINAVVREISTTTKQYTGLDGFIFWLLGADEYSVRSEVLSEYTLKATINYKDGKWLVEGDLARFFIEIKGELWLMHWSEPFRWDQDKMRISIPWDAGEMPDD